MRGTRKKEAQGIQSFFWANFAHVGKDQEELIPQKA